jgi:hypothetical protein
MTIVNSTYKFIYVHIPKTAGTAVKKYLGQFTRYCDVEVGGVRDAEAIADYYRKRFWLAKHSFAREVRDAVGTETFKQFFKFSIVRNPYARAISTFNFLKYTWRAWPQSDVMDQFGNLQEFATSDFFAGRGPDRILLPQTRWVMNGRGRPGIDFLGHVETLERDVAEICTRLGLVRPERELLRVNTSSAGPMAVAVALRGVAVDAIRLRYASDFEYLGYSRDPERMLDSGATADVAPIEA